MNRKLRRWVALSLAIGGAAVFSCSPSSDDGNGGADAEAEAQADAEAEAGSEAGSDAGADAATDAATDADADLDAAADADADADTDAAPPDAGLRWVVVSCSLIAPAPNANAQWIASDGKRYRINGIFGPPKAGAILGSGGPAPIGTLSDADLAELLAAAETLDTSAAGTTTTTGPPRHMSTRNGKLHSAGVAANPEILVHSLVDGLEAGARTEITHNDPAAAVIRRWGCFEAE